MFSAVLNSETAINVSIKIMNAFVEMRRFMASNAMSFERISAVEDGYFERDSCSFFLALLNCVFLTG